jgi:hypothetical protein
MLELVGIAILSLLLRLLVVRHAVTEFDTFGHLYFAKEVKVQGVGPFGQIVTKVVGAAGFSQQFLWHWIVGFFPIDLVLRFQRWINPLLDATFAALIYPIALRLGLDKEASLLMTLLYLLTPMWYSGLSMGPRIRSLTPRLASELATNFFFMVILLPLGLPVWLALAGGALLSAFVLLSSKFGLQAMLFLVPLTSVIARDFLPVLALILGLMIAIGLTKGSFLKSVNTQVHHLIWYFKKNLKGEMSISKRNSLAMLVSRPASRGGFLRHMAAIMYRSVSHNSYTAILFKMPVLLVAFFFYGLWLLQENNTFPLFILSPVVAATIVFFLINLPPLLFLGEAERYLNHVAFFIAALAAISAIELGLTWILWAVVFYGALYWFAEVLFLDKLLPTSSRSIKNIDDKIISYLNTIPKKPMIILTYPYHAVGVWRIMLETVHKVVYCFTTSQSFMDMFENKYAADYPYFKLDKLDELAHEFNVDIFIVRNQSLVSRGYEQWTPTPMWKKLNIGEPVYAVYTRISDSSPSSLDNQSVDMTTLASQSDTDHRQ